MLKDFLFGFIGALCIGYLLVSPERWMKGVTNKLDEIIRLLERGR